MSGSRARWGSASRTLAAYEPTGYGPGNADPATPSGRVAGRSATSLPGRHASHGSHARAAALELAGERARRPAHPAVARPPAHAAGEVAVEHVVVQRRDRAGGRVLGPAARGER